MVDFCVAWSRVDVPCVAVEQPTARLGEEVVARARFVAEAVAVWISSDLGVALHVRVPRQAPQVEAVTREQAVPARELAGQWVIVAGAVVVQPGSWIRALAREPVARRRRPAAVA